LNFPKLFGFPPPAAYMKELLIGRKILYVLIINKSYWR